MTHNNKLIKWIDKVTTWYKEEWEYFSFCLLLLSLFAFNLISFILKYFIYSVNLWRYLNEMFFSIIKIIFIFFLFDYEFSSALNIAIWYGMIWYDMNIIWSPIPFSCNNNQANIEGPLKSWIDLKFEKWQRH